MRTSTKVFIGVLPAVLFAVAFGLAYLSYALGPLPVVKTRDTLLMASGVAGTAGLVWSVRGYGRNKAVLIILLLLTGVAGMGAFAVLLLQGWSIGSNGRRILSPSFLGSTALFAWFVIGPIVVGLLQTWGAIRALRAAAEPRR